MPVSRFQNRRGASRRWPAVLVMALGLAILPATPAAASAAGAAARVDAAGSPPALGRCDPHRPPVVTGAVPDTALDDAFDSYGNSGAGWTGGDSTYSVPLPGGRDVWLFSDTFLGPVNPDGSRPADTPFIHNSFVVQRRGTMSTVTGGTPDRPTSILESSDPDAWYWLGDGMRNRDELNVIFLRFRRTGTGQFDFAWDGNVLARFDARTLALRGTQPLPGSAGIEWASYLMRKGGYTYIYGVEDLGAVKYMHVARVHGTDLGAPWRFWDGSGWSADESASARVMDGVANEYSVTPYGPGYLLITQDSTELLSAHIVAYYSCSPTGPFTGKQTVYTTPETGPFGSYANGNVFTYNAHAHPELGADGALVVSYNVNSFDPSDLYADTSIYRPRFVTVHVTPARGAGAAEQPWTHR